MNNLKWNFLQILLSLVPLIGFGQNSSEREKGEFSKKWKDHVETHMISQFNFGYEFNENRTQQIKFILKPELRIKFNKKLRLTSALQVYGEVLDNLEPGKPTQRTFSRASKPRLIGDRMEFELREFYLDWFVSDKSTIRLGKQQIVWGETDGLKVLDVVNPQNFREFMLEEFQDSRIPLWAIKAEFPIRNLNFELLWVPDLTYHQNPDFTSPYFPSALIPAIPTDFSVKQLEVKKPNRIIQDSDIGLKLSAFLKGWDLSFSYLYHYDDFPVLDFKLDQESDAENLLFVQPCHHRLHTIGGTFNNALGAISLRGEVAYNMNRHFMTTTPNVEKRGTVSDQFLLAIGADWLFKETMLSIQLFNDLLIRDITAFNRDKYEVNYSVLASQELLNDDLKFEILAVQNLKRGDGMIRPKVQYYLSSNLQLSVGSTIFYGDHKGLFGQFQKRSRIMLGLKWGI